MAAHFDTEAENAKLADLREKEEEDLTRILSEKYRFPYTDLSVVPINVDALRIIPEKEARDAEAVAFDKAGKHLSLALRNPQNTHLGDLEHALEARGFILERFLISGKSLELGLNRYKELSLAHTSKVGGFDIADDELAELSTSLTFSHHFHHLNSFLRRRQTQSLHLK
jgi:hypothetical protein